MRDDEVRLTQIYVAPTGSKVPSYAPNSEDTPAASFDLIITGVAGDGITATGGPYTLSYWAVDLLTMSPAGAAFNALPNVLPPQVFGGAQWTPRTAANEDFFTIQTFPIAIPAGLHGHILQYSAVLTAQNGDIVSFVRSEPFVLV